MWLINCTTLRLEHFHEGQTPPYVCLSHTWGASQDELTFLDLRDDTPTGRQKLGYQKLVGTAVETRKLQDKNNDFLNYCWVDTCCIDKSSSAELSEAINSMFKWYETSHTCLVYLADYEHESEYPCDVLPLDVAKSRWFTRGWTLQELLAPAVVKFFSSEWVFLGERSNDLNASSILSEITGISATAIGFGGYPTIAEFPVITRMSWAANRSTTRLEDQAYCLLGIFNVNMPLLYGEGPNALIRLQEEIMRTSTDLSLLGWRFIERDRYMDSTLKRRRFLAQSVKHFEWAVGRSFVKSMDYSHVDQFRLSNIGVSVHMTYTMPDSEDSDKIFGMLGFKDFSQEKDNDLLIRLDVDGDEPGPVEEARISEAFRAPALLAHGFASRNFKIQRLLLLDELKPTFPEEGRIHLGSSLGWGGENFPKIGTFRLLCARTDEHHKYRCWPADARVSRSMYSPHLPLCLNPFVSGQGGVAVEVVDSIFRPNFMFAIKYQQDRRGFCDLGAVIWRITNVFDVSLRTFVSDLTESGIDVRQSTVAGDENNPIDWALATVGVRVYPGRDGEVQTVNVSFSFREGQPSRLSTTDLPIPGCFSNSELGNQSYTSRPLNVPPRVRHATRPGRPISGLI